MRIGLIVIIACFVIEGHSQTSNRDERKEYNGKYFRIKYPTAWDFDDSKKLGAELFLFSPLEDNEDKFRENVNVLIQDLKSQGIDLAKYKAITDKQIAELGTNGKLYESVIDKTGKIPVYRISYMMVQQGLSLRIISKCFIRNEKAYLVTFTAQFNRFDKYEAEAKEIIETFELID